jgi:hypothetical protein
MDGTADHSGILFDPLTPTLRNVLPAFPTASFHVVVSLRESGYTRKRESTYPQALSLRPIVPKPPLPLLSLPCHAGSTGPDVRRLPVGASQ